jgi:hypothetical protein
MNKKIISLVAVLVFVLGLATVSLAADWAEIIYGGYVSVTLPQPVTVLADTGIWVFNPNASVITCRISHVIDKHGTVLLTNQMFYDGGVQVSSIPAGGHVWTTIGLMLTKMPQPGPVPGTYKLMYRIACSGTTARVPVVEIKEVIYTTPQVQEVPNPIYNPNVIKTWSEAALGGPYGPGKYKP